MKPCLTRRVVLGASAALLTLQSRAQAAAKRIMTVAGSGAQGVAADGESAKAAKLDQPYGVLVGPDGALYWADFGSNRVLRLDRKSGKVFVVAGTGEKGHAGDGGLAKAAVLSAPHEVRFDR
ncbi:MAG TPA: hypothetical protein VHM27_08885, partial [Rhizomicrobium sp.]|nr:hypothetical protein [Rhizomicrobium sp.]